MNVEQSAGAQPRAPEVRGWRVLRLLGVGGAAAVWLVEPAAGGEPRALKCLRQYAGKEASAQADLRREVRLLGRYEHPHLVRVHDALALPGAHGCGLLMDYAAGGSLGALLAARGRLGVGETVTVLPPLLQALAFLHADGVTHADVAPGNVLFTAEGKPLLADLGLARIVGEARGAGRAGTPGFTDPAGAGRGLRLAPEADVYAAAALGWTCLAGTAPPEAAVRPPLPVIAPAVPAELAAALEAGLDPDPASRPSAAELAHAVYRSARAEPLDLSAAVHESVLPELLTREQAAAPRRPHRRRRSTPPGPRRIARRGRLSARPGGPPGTRRGAGRSAGPGARRSALPVLLGAAVVLALGALAAVGLHLPGGGSAAPAAAARTEPAAVTDAPPATPGDAGIPAEVRARLAAADPATALTGLAWLRAYALRTGRPELLAEVNASGSPAAVRDSALAARLGGHLFAGLGITVSGVSAAPASGGRSDVTATAVTSGFTERDRLGGALRMQPAATVQRLTLVLRNDGGRWRIEDVRQAR
ncbi:protein kinase [Paenarthrobacter sp. DKR-5]|nr:protein kinase [Paenarthrobacter sp. DKR-5]